MKNVYLLCFFINIALAAWALTVNISYVSIILSVVCAALCLITYLRDDV